MIHVSIGVRFGDVLPVLLPLRRRILGVDAQGLGECQHGPGMPRTMLAGYPGGGVPTELGVWPDGVVVEAPACQHHSGVGQRGKQRLVECTACGYTSRRRPLKLSRKAFWVGLPGAM